MGRILHGCARTTAVIIDRNGQMKEYIEGVIFAEEFEEKIKPLIAADSAPKDVKSQ